MYRWQRQIADEPAHAVRILLQHLRKIHLPVYHSECRQQRRLALRGCRNIRQRHRMDQRSRMGKIKRTRILTFKTIQL